jgi:hypothetical protein
VLKIFHETFGSGALLREGMVMHLRLPAVGAASDADAAKGSAPQRAVGARRRRRNAQDRDGSRRVRHFHAGEAMGVTVKNKLRPAAPAMTAPSLSASVNALRRETMPGSGG